MTTAQKEKQLKALIRKLESGKVPNPYALRNKIELLKRQIDEARRRQYFYEFLAQ